MLFSTNDAETLSYLYAKKNVNTYLRQYTTINWKWITNLNVKFATIKLLEENIAMNFCDFGLNKKILDTTPKA